MAFPTRVLGKNGPEVTAIGMGLMGLSAFYGKTTSFEERLLFLDHLYASGERFWDTADAYGDSEELIGMWFKANPEKRQGIILATKFGNMGHGLARTDAAYVPEACAKSLKALNTDYIDLYYVHRADPKVPIEQTVSAMAQLKEQGEIKYLGLSEVSSTTLRRAHSVHPITAVQVEYSPFTLEIESEQTGILSTCKELGVGVVAYSPLGRGFLTGQLRGPEDLDKDDWRRTVPRFSAENFSKNLELVNELTSFAERKGCSTGQLVLAWLLKQWDMVVPIPGTTKIANFKDNMGALDIDLSATEEQEIRSAVTKAEIIGDRYPPGWSQTLFVDTVELK
ncbi:hypothetical protein ACSS6W_002085 [Trichoderma asperelloides]